jgi:hypothetical protein
VYEALELRDGGKDYLGKGVSKVSYRCELLSYSFQSYVLLCVDLLLCLYVRARSFWSFSILFYV